ncbi:MAG: type II toxin-antitoxin system PemK/MazF family toxin [Clostridiales bacterium]|nr:type II toxin-antitoxin system PemK/MazF family toxin [Clostridiales bacterium]
MTFAQGDIIRFNFDPTLGHEQAGYRPALVISKTILNQRTGQVIVCPITTKDKPYATRIKLDSGTETQGFVICEHLKTIDITARSPKFIEKLSDEKLAAVLDMVRMFF